jgi:hypothetical protein
MNQGNPHGYYPGQSGQAPIPQVAHNQAPVVQGGIPQAQPAPMMQQQTPGVVAPGAIPNFVSFHSETDIVDDGLIEPIQKCKELFHQLKHSLQVIQLIN